VNRVKYFSCFFLIFSIGNALTVTSTFEAKLIEVLKIRLVGNMDFGKVINNKKILYKPKEKVKLYFESGSENERVKIYFSSPNSKVQKAKEFEYENFQLSIKLKNGNIINPNIIERRDYYTLEIPKEKNRHYYIDGRIKILNSKKKKISEVITVKSEYLNIPTKIK